MAQPQRAGRVLRVHGGRLLFGAHARRQCRRHARDQAAPARAGRRVAAQPQDHGAGRGAGDAARARADRALPACSTPTARSSPAAPRTRPASSTRSPPCRSARSRTSPRRCSKPFWFQLYVMRDRGFVKALIERAEAAKCSALFLTVDLPVNGQRHVDMRNGLSVPPRLTARTVFDVLRRPTWAWRILNGKRKTFANIDGHLPAASAAITLAEWTHSQFDVTVSWKDVAWIRSIWPRQAGAERHPRSRGCARGAEDRRRRRGGVEPRRAPARRRALDDRGAAQGRGRDRRAEGGPDRFRHPHRAGHLPRARARRQCLHDRPRVRSTASARAAKPASRARSASSAASSTPR